jgi:hypothetical protein
MVLNHAYLNIALALLIASAIFGFFEDHTPTDTMTDTLFEYAGYFLGIMILNSLVLFLVATTTNREGLLTQSLQVDDKFKRRVSIF